MSIELPKSMDECVYFTNRSVGKGKIKAWALREKCPKCQKSLMQKPKNPKTGKFKLRAKEYICSDCGYTVSLEEYENTLILCAVYTCPKCQKNGEAKVPFKRKKVKIFDEESQKEKTADAVQFICQHCGEKINVTKKMK